MTQVIKTTQAIKTKGIAGSALNLLLAFIVLIVGLFSIELSRYTLARDQLKCDLEAAVLCCQTTLASTGTPTDSSNQTTAINTALSLFQQNAILGQSLSNASLVSLPTQFDVQPGETQICFQFLDPITLLPTAQNGTVIQATGAYCYSPIYGKFIGLGGAQFTVQLAVNSGLPQLDVVFVYDVSGAENRQTPVTYVQRYWDPHWGIDYLVTPYIGSSPTVVTAGGPITPFGITDPLNQGPNPLPPENLDNSINSLNPQLSYAEQGGAATQMLTGAQAYAAPPGNYPPTGGQPPKGKLSPPILTTMSRPITLYNGIVVDVVLGGGSSYGISAHGSKPNGPTVSGSLGMSTSASILDGANVAQYDSYFTDIVVNIDNNPTFQSDSVTYNGNNYNFPSLGALVEASRGNLETPRNADGAGLNLIAMGLNNADVQSGYYAAYVQAAILATQPMNTVANATLAFVNQLATVSDVHFGCLTFNDYDGTDAYSEQPPAGVVNFITQSNPTPPHIGSGPPSVGFYNIASTYPEPSINIQPDGSTVYDIVKQYPLPNILLDPSGNTTQQNIINTLPTIRTWGNCNVAQALTQALVELAPQVVGSPAAPLSRPSANKAIVLISSQAPNVGLNADLGTTSALADALSVAQLAHQAGIPIYCVAVSQTDTDAANEDAAYNDNNGGIAATAGFGSKYYRVDWSNPTATQSSLTTVFANIARRLTCVVH